MAQKEGNSILVGMNDRAVVDRLLGSVEPSVRWKVRTQVLLEDPSSKSMKELREEVRRAPRTRALLSGFEKFSRIRKGLFVYEKWQGAHWVLATLADLGYPPGDKALVPLRDRILNLWLGEEFSMEFEALAKSDAYKRRGVPIMEGRYRRCASQQGNPLYFLSRLGLENDRSSQLVERLLHWQWPDGGWNCDKDPRADSSSFMETLFPMLGLYLYAQNHEARRAAQASERAREVFLSRHLFKRRSDGKLIHSEFVALHYPLYWHYDILHGLKAMAVVGAIRDPRCNDAIDLLEKKRLPDGGWPAERRYYKVNQHRIELGSDYVDWGGTSTRKMNEWVTADALGVLVAAGRLKI